MRPFVVSLALVGLSAASAVAQERGSLVIDAMTTPGRHFGLGYYVTNALSLRPTLGIGYSGNYGTTVNLGTDLRYDLLPGRRVSPYLTAGFNFMRNSALLRYDAGGLLLPDMHAMRYGGGAGIRAFIKHGFSLVGEGRAMSSELQTSFAGPTIRDGAHFEAAVGLSYAFH